MSNALSQMPDKSTFGEEFNYAVWTPGTQIMLCNVPWNSDYRDVVHYPTDNALLSYLQNSAGPTITIDRLTYARPGEPVRINLPFNRVYKYNYLRVFNPAQPVPGADSGRALYYFIVDVNYIAPNNTQLVVQLDVWQSFSRNVTMGNCFIERGHIGIANENAFDDHGRTYLTVPEGMDVGNEYIVSDTYEHDLVDLRNITDINDVYGIIVATTISFSGSPGTIDAPNLKTATGSLFERLPNGCELYYFDEPASFLTWQSAIANTPWIAQGVISVTVVPRLTGVTLPPPIDPATGQPQLGSGSKMYNLYSVSEIPNELVVLSTSFRNDVPLGRYSRLKKFLTFPYTVVELTTYSGNPLILKPECINTDGLVVNKMMHLAPPSPRIVFAPKGYNAAKGDTGQYAGEFLDMTTGIMDLPQFSIVNNSYLSYMASNRNMIQYQHSSADWSQQKALNGAATAFQQANLGMAQDLRSTGIGNQAQIAQMRNANATLGWRSAQRAGNALIDGIESAAGGNIIGGAINAVQGGANAAADYAIGSNDNEARTSIDVAANRSQLKSRNEYNSGMRDTNKALAEVSAKGDYANAIAGINARVQDARMMQPTTSGQIGGDAFNLSTFKWSIIAKLKIMQPSAMAMIGEFWLRYGYAVNRFGRMPSNYQVMDKFTYWKLSETYISSSTCPEKFKQSIRGIFEKGVTVWSNPADIGNIDTADNAPLTGITL